MPALLIAANAYSQEILKSVQWSEPVNAGEINSPADDFAPCWNKFEKVLYFNSDRSGISKFYRAERADSSFKSPLLVPGPLSTDKSNLSYITFLSEDAAYLSAFRLYKDRSYLNIMSTVKRKGRWTDPEPVPEFASESFSSHPTVSPDGSFLIFCSGNDKSGDLDLRISYKTQDGAWSVPIPINELNTAGNEITPFLASPDTLYFSSDGLGGEGGYDIFYSVRSGSKWQSPLPLHGINSAGDDSDFSLLPDGRAVFASNRPGGKGMTDLWISAGIKGESKPQALPAELELSIGSQVTIVKTDYDFSWSPVYPMRYIFSDQEISPAGIKFPQNADFSLMPEEISTISPLLAASNAALISHAQIELEITGGTDSDALSAKADKFAKMLVEKYGLSEESVRITHSEKKLSSNGYITIKCDSADIFSHVRSGTAKIKYTPESIPVAINCRPKEFAKSVSISVSIKGINERTVPGTGIMPDTINVSLLPFADKIKESESIDFVLSVTDVNSSIKTSKFSVINSVSQTKTPAQTIKYGSTYKSVYLFSVSPEDAVADANRAVNDNFAGLDDLKSPGSASGISVVYFTDNDETASIAAAIAQTLRERTGKSVGLMRDTGSRKPGKYSRLMFEIRLVN